MTDWVEIDEPTENDLDPELFMTVLTALTKSRQQISEAVELCASMDRGVGYRKSGDHSTWGDYHEGMSDFAGKIEQILDPDGWLGERCRKAQQEVEVET